MSFWKKLFGPITISGSVEDETEIPPEFGYSKDDPIPCESIPVSYWYLGRLVDREGRSVTFNRVGSFSSNRVKELVDGYRVTTSTGEEVTIFIWPYADLTSSKAPLGFSLSPPTGR